MELIRGIHNIKADHLGCVLTIGKFDGVHRGHQQILSRLVERAKEKNIPSMVMVFEPQPEEVFAPEHAPARLSRWRDKYLLLKSIGIDRLLCVKFDRKFSQMSAESFIDELLVNKLGTKFLVVGDDFRFGQGRRGDFDMLLEAGQRHDFEVVSTQSYRYENCRISSSAIRQAIDDNDFELVKHMLGRPFVIHGRVVHGEKNGRKLGFPTANIVMRRCNSPVSGVFAVRVYIQSKVYDGIANAGVRPTLSGERQQLEVHIFEFDQDLYGRQIDVEIVTKIRDEEKFSSLDALQQQIAIDVQQVKDLFLNR